MTFREALCQAMKEEMERDKNVFLLGEEVAEYDGAYKVSKGLLEQFGPKRVIDAPISEGGFAGLGIGSAMVGLRPIIEMMTWNFGIQAFDQIINNAAKIRYMSGGQFTVPIVFRGPNGSAHMLSSQHSQNIEPLLSNIPGLKIITVATPYDGKGLLKSSIRDNNPTIFLESEMLYGLKGEIPIQEYLIPIGVGDIKREGNDVTLISWGKALHLTLKAAEELQKINISAEVLDPRTLNPLDTEIIFNSIRKTNRCVIIEDSWPFASVGAQIVDYIQHDCFDFLDAPIERVSQEAVPVPYNETLEKAALPTMEKIITAVKIVSYKNN